MNTLVVVLLFVWPLLVALPLGILVGKAFAFCEAGEEPAPWDDPEWEPEPSFEWPAWEPTR